MLYIDLTEELYIENGIYETLEHCVIDLLNYRGVCCELKYVHHFLTVVTSISDGKFWCSAHVREQ